MEEFLKCPPKEHRALMCSIPGFYYEQPVGSAVFMENAADIDYAIVLHPNKLAEARTYMLDNGWVDCSAEDYQMQGNWRAFRKDKYNFILTEDPVWAQKFANAAQVAKFLNITDKETRVKINWIIRDDWTAEAVVETQWAPPSTSTKIE